MLSKFQEAKDEPVPKRISTPAGLRLSTIIENQDHHSTSRPNRYSSRGLMFAKSNSTFADHPRESHEAGSSSQGYSYSVFSEKSGHGGTLPARLRNNKFLSRRGGWCRLALFALLFILIVISIVLGCVFGLRKNKSSSNSTSQSDGSSSGSQSSSPSGTGTTSPSTNGTSQKFPLGSYAITTFLDTVTTSCTANPSTWSCFPYVIYNDNPTASATTFNWIISAASGGSSNNYQISSTENPFAISFKNVPLKLVGAGTDAENYQFQVRLDKQVVPSAALTTDGATTLCYYNGTTFTGYLYTKAARDYSTSTSNSTSSASTTQWPFRARAEQVSAGGENVPNCYRVENGKIGGRITEGLAAQGQDSMCSCLYRNYKTPQP